MRCRTHRKLSLRFKQMRFVSVARRMPLFPERERHVLGHCRMRPVLGSGGYAGVHSTTAQVSKRKASFTKPVTCPWLNKCEDKKITTPGNGTITIIETTDRTPTTHGEYWPRGLNL